MTPEILTQLLQDQFGAAVTVTPPDAWQVETEEFRLLLLLSRDLSWLRVLVPIAAADAVRPYLNQVLTANFDLTQAARYALHQEVLWGVFQAGLADLAPAELRQVIQQLIQMKRAGVEDFFTAQVDTQIQQIVQVAKQRGQSLEETMQTLERFYAEGIMGNMEGGPEDRQRVLAAWRRQLERFWSEGEAMEA